MIGTITNTACIIVGSVLGSLLKRGIKEKYQTALFDALGICTILLGANAFVHNMPKSEAPVLFIVSMAVGTLVGYMMDLDGKFEKLVGKLKGGASGAGQFGQASEVGNAGALGTSEAGQVGASGASIGGSQPRLSEGLSTGILLYCIGTFSMLGPVFSALNGDNTYLFTNSTLDLISSAVLASTYGIGMIWAAPVLFCWQGMFYLLAKCSAAIISPQLVCELSIVGGLLISASGFNILKIKNLKTLNMLPSLLVPPLFFLLKYLISLFS